MRCNNPRLTQKAKPLTAVHFCSLPFPSRPGSAVFRIASCRVMSRQILLNIEHRLMSQATMPCEYDSLTIMQKVEVFEMSLQHTAGQDLSKVEEAEAARSSFFFFRLSLFFLSVFSLIIFSARIGWLMSPFLPCPHPGSRRILALVLPPGRGHSRSPCCGPCSLFVRWPSSWPYSYLLSPRFSQHWS